MYPILKRLLECAECKSSCVEKGICDFAKEELPLVIKLLSRVFKKSIDETLDFRYGVLRKINEKMAIRGVLATVGLEELSPFLEDREVEDIVVIPGRPIYITRKSGKEKADVTAELKTVKSLLKIAYLKGVELTTSNPSLRYGLKLGDLRLRISLDLPPVVPVPQAYIRIHRGKIAVADMLKSGFITEEQLKTVYAWVKEGRHIVITGPPGSGKTTLLSVIDDLIPGQLQRVYIDEADEFDDDPDKNQIKIRNVNKLREVYASLNRNIDIIIIGELQYEEHFNAFKTAVEIGLQTLATMHATSVKDALKRLERRGISRENLAIIQLAKRYGEGIERRVVELYAS